MYEPIKKKSNIKKIILGSFLGILIGSLLGTSIAMFSYNATSSNSKLVVGDIYMKYKETTTLTLENAMPSTTYDSNYKFEFTIEGKNTTNNKDIWYEIKVKRGDIPNGKTEQDRIPDRFIKYRLVEKIDNGEEVVVVDGDSWEGLNLGKTIYVDKINRNQTTNTEHKYKLYMWISNKLVIGNESNADFTIENWNKAFASIKVDVNGDFTEKFVDEEYNTVNAMSDSFGNIYSKYSYIKEIYFNKMDESTMNTRYNAATIKADLTYNNEGKVLAWLETNQDDNTKYNLYVASDGKTYFTTGRTLFSAFYNMEKIEFNNVDTSRVTDMTNMFSASGSQLTKLDLSSFNVENVSTMYGMFVLCNNLKMVNLSNWKTSNLNDIRAMFFNDSKLEKIYVSSDWDISNVVNNSDMFSGCTSLEGGNGTHYDENNPTDKTYAIIDGTNGQPGYLTDIADKPNN